MIKYYANLLGKWIDITEEGTVADNQKPSDYFNEHLIFKVLPDGSTAKVADCFEYGYINVQYQNKNYRISPDCIQIVTE